jgi:two-component system, cell cycle response regulator
MVSSCKYDEIKASGKLPTPKGIALQVIQLTHSDDVTNLEIAHLIKSDPALCSRIIKVANARMAYQARPLISIVDAVAVLGLNMTRQLTLGLSLMENKGICKEFDYQGFWSRSLLTAITAQNLVMDSGIGSSEEVFILGLLGQIGSLAMATTFPEQYGRILTALDADLPSLENAQFGINHNQLTQAMLADWGMPRVFQEVALHHEHPIQANFTENSRDWRLLNVMHIADYFSRVCMAHEPQQHKMIPNLLLIATRMGVELEALTKLCDKSVQEWHEWCKLCNLRSAAVPLFAKLLSAVPLAPEMPCQAMQAPSTNCAFC